MTKTNFMQNKNFIAIGLFTTICIKIAITLVETLATNSRVENSIEKEKMDIEEIEFRKIIKKSRDVIEKDCERFADNKKEKLIRLQIKYKFNIVDLFVSSDKKIDSNANIFEMEEEQIAADINLLNKYLTKFGHLSLMGMSKFNLIDLNKLVIKDHNNIISEPLHYVNITDMTCEFLYNEIVYDNMNHLIKAVFKHHKIKHSRPRLWENLIYYNSKSLKVIRDEFEDSLRKKFVYTLQKISGIHDISTCGRNMWKFRVCSKYSPNGKFYNVIENNHPLLNKDFTELRYGQEFSIKGD